MLVFDILMTTFTVPFVIKYLNSLNLGTLAIMLVLLGTDIQLCSSDPKNVIWISAAELLHVVIAYIVALNIVTAGAITIIAFIC